MKYDKKKKDTSCFLVKTDKHIWIKEEVCWKINDSSKRWLSPLSSQKFHVHTEYGHTLVIIHRFYVLRGFFLEKIGFGLKI